MKHETIVIDNGAGTAKVGYAGQENPSCIIPNCTAKVKNQNQVLVGAETQDQIANSSQLVYTRPFDRGYLVNGATEVQVWQHLLGRLGGGAAADPSTCALLATVPPFMPPLLQEDIAQLVFEEFRFKSACLRPAASLVNWGLKQAEAGGNNGRGGYSVVVDTGFSFTHVVPFVRGRAQQEAVLRINVGGKLLTNLLKETVSYRQWNMMDETDLVNEVKEALCYVAQDFGADLEACHRGQGLDSSTGQQIVKEFVMPDYQNIMKGFVRDIRPVNKDDDDDDDEEESEMAASLGPDPQQGQGQEDHQALRMGSERFTIPEALFRPQDCVPGLRQMGLAEAVATSIDHCPTNAQGLLSSQVVCVGGNTLLPGFGDRLQQDLRSLLPAHLEVNAKVVEDPIIHAWKNASQFACSGEFQKASVSREAYLEEGLRACMKMFNEW